MQENSGYAEDGLVEYLVGCSRVICSSQAWSARWGGNGTGSFVIEIWSDAAKLTDVRVAGFRQS